MSERIGIQDLIDTLAEKHGITKKDAEAFVKELFNLIEEALESDQYVKIKGLGTFKLTKVESRESVNVNTGERIQIEGHTKVSFTPEANVKDLINKPFAHFETVVLNDETVLDDTPVIEDEDGEEEQEEITQEKVIESPKVETTQKTKEQIIAAELEANKNMFPSVKAPVAKKEEPNIIEEEVATIKEEEKIESSIVANETEEPIIPKEKAPSKKNIGYFVAVIILFVLVVCATLFYIYKPETISQWLPEPKQEVKENKSAVPADGPLDQTIENLEKEAQDTMLRATQKIQQETKMDDTTKTFITGVRKGFDNVIPDSTSYVIVGTMTTYKLGSGETLTMVSKRFYETKDLWPYILKYNRDVIKNPNRVPSGITLRIPALRDKQE